MKQLDFLYIVDNQIYNVGRAQLSEFLKEYVNVPLSYLNMDGTLPDRVINSALLLLVNERVFDAAELTREIAHKAGVVVNMERLLDKQMRVKRRR
jgi:hypothetical protein